MITRVLLLVFLLVGSASFLVVFTRPEVTSTPLPTPTVAATSTLMPPFKPPDRPLHSTRIIVTNDTLWAVHPASNTVTRQTLPNGDRVWQTNILCTPGTLARGATRLFVTCFDSGELVVLDDDSGTVVARTLVGHGPFGVLIAGARVYVTLAHENALLALLEDTLAPIARVPTGFQPRGLALKGDRLYVVHLYDASVQVFDASTLEFLGEIRIGHEAALAESVTLHPDRDRAYVPHQRQNITNMARSFDSTVFPLVSVLDTEQLRPIRQKALTLDTVDKPVGMPIATVLSPDGTRLYTVNAASDDVSVVDLKQGIGVGHIAVGQQPRDLALSPDGGRLYTLNLVSDNISVVDTDQLTFLRTLKLAADPRPADIQQGEQLFFTSRPDTIARGNWIACASCHFDGGFDARTWLGTGGGPRNTVILRGIDGTTPLHWSADRPNVRSFQETFVGLMAGTGLSSKKLDSLTAFLNSLQPFPSPFREADGSLTEEAALGATVFKQVGCVVCHSPPLFTDLQLHDVGTGEPYRDHPSGSGKVAETLGPAFDTPSLRELWLTAPYLHDGRATTLRDVLTTFNIDGQHGDTAGLSEAELSAIEAFLLGLPLTGKDTLRLFGE